MHDERVPLDDAREPVFTPQHSQNPVIEEPPSVGWKIAAVICVMLAVLAIGYGWLQHDAAQQLAAEREDLRVSLAEAKTRDDALSAKVNALSVAAVQQKTAQAGDQTAHFQAEALGSEQFSPQTAEVPAQAAQVPRRHTRSATARAIIRHRAPADDPRWKQVQQQLTDEQKQLVDNQQELAKSNEQISKTQADLETTKTDLNTNLQSTRTQLGGDIARNHEQLVALQKKGERNYYEFSFEKSKTYHHTGPISLALRKADPKHEYCDLEMVVDDKTLTRKHVNLYESITLYPEGYPQAVEVIVNHIDKDTIAGYVSEPKYRPTERAAASTPAAPPATANAGQVATTNAAPVATANAAQATAPSEPKLDHRDEPATSR